MQPAQIILVILLLLDLNLTLLFKKQFFLCADGFTVQPVSINTTLNSTVNFSCEATGDYDVLNFYADGIQANREEIRNRGFEVTITETDGVVRGVLTAKANGINNNTNVTCVASSLSILPVTSNTVFLMIQGLLDSVVDLDYTFINGSSVLLTWTAPYTLDNVPITGYYIVNGLVNVTTTNKSIILSATNPDPCILNNVSVSPINDVGIGSSNNISFYYETVPFITPPVSVSLVVDEQQVLLNISIKITNLCIGEYPNNVTVIILTTNNEIQDSTSIPTQVNDQLMITGVITVPNNLNTFIVNVSLSNNGGEFLVTYSIIFGIIAPVTEIVSMIENCSTINITWNAPKVDDSISILYYNLSIYDDINDQLLKSITVNDTSYQFVDNNLFINRYTYVITGVNELGEGVSNKATISYQRVPRPAKENTVFIKLTSTQNMLTIVEFNILVILECTGEAPNSATVTVHCNDTGSIYSSSYIIEYTKQPNNITGLVSIAQYQECTISIVFSNEAGSSEPFILSIGELVWCLHYIFKYYVNRYISSS
uniref:Fibronectin type-III domain-containing protein n=1 Tax=Amphimedon queenslandica TaxID=400682 RepID=A0A1X7T8J0_AMPQE